MHCRGREINQLPTPGRERTALQSQRPASSSLFLQLQNPYQKFRRGLQYNGPCPFRIGFLLCLGIWHRSSGVFGKLWGWRGEGSCPAAFGGLLPNNNLNLLRMMIVLFFASGDGLSVVLTRGGLPRFLAVNQRNMTNKNFLRNKETVKL